MWSHGVRSPPPPLTWKQQRHSLQKGSKSGETTGTLFIIDKGWGYDIQPYSLFPDEEEIFLESERQFRVVSVLNVALTVINLEMLDTPLSIPEVFGGWVVGGADEKGTKHNSLFSNFSAFPGNDGFSHLKNEIRSSRKMFSEKRLNFWLFARLKNNKNNKHPLSGHLHHRLCCSDDLPFSAHCCCSRKWRYWS